MKTCFELDTLAFPIKLEQLGSDRFVLTYGVQVSATLTYNEASYKLGAAIMHALACDGMLDNSED